MAQPTDPAPNRSSSAYIPGYKPSHITIHEWRTAENSAGYLLPTLRRLAISNPRLRLLDVGAGPGTLTATLAKHFPQGSAVAVDISAEVLSRAAETAAAHGVGDRVSRRVASVFDLPFPDASFDVVHAQQLLCHLDRPVEALRSMLRVARPGGGVVAVRECEVRSWSVHPETPALRAMCELQRGIQKLEGGSDDLGLRLVGLAMEAGAERGAVAASMGTWCYSTREEREMWASAMAARLREGPMRFRAMENGLATAEELDGMAEAWDRWVEAEDGMFACLHGEIIITK